MKKYNEKIFWDLYYLYDFKSTMNVPFINKTILNTCCGNFFLDKKKMDNIFSDLILIFNQKPLIIKSKKSISEFKLRKGLNIGFKITLRKKNMYNFLYKFININLPRIKNFSGLSRKSFDKYGNYNFGISDSNIFYELENNVSFGFNINLVFNKTLNSEISFNILKLLGFPFKNV